MVRLVFIAYRVRFEDLQVILCYFTVFIYGLLLFAGIPRSVFHKGDKTFAWWFQPGSGTCSSATTQ